MLVVVHHLSYRAMPGGHIGVDIFFVLSPSYSPGLG